MANYMRWFFATALIPLVVFFVVGRSIEPLHGDIARIGDLPESDFGGRFAQPVVRIRPNPDNAHPAVAVLGDSFSASNVWQSVVIDQTGLGITTFNWSDLRNIACLDAWIAALQKSLPSVRLLIIETVEREYVNHFRSAHACRLGEDRIKPYVVRSRMTDATRPFLMSALMPDPIYALKALGSRSDTFNERTPRGGAVVAPLSRADLFSNRRADRLVYFNVDETKDLWTEVDLVKSAAALAHVRDVAARSRIALLFMMVPDKLTVYGRFLVPSRPDASSRNRAVWQAIQAHGVAGINPTDMLMQTAATEQDTYLPDDTHLGTRGYMLLGNFAANVVQQTMRDRISLDGGDSAPVANDGTSGTSRGN